MKGLYLYCLVTPGTDPPDTEGIDGAPVTALDAGAVGLWLSRIASAPAFSLEHVRRHNAVVMAALEAGVTPLPMRFGQWFPTRERLDARLRARGAAYEERLGELTGSAEYGIRVAHRKSPPPPGSDGPATTGRQHMEALARRSREQREVARRGERLATELRERVGGLVKRERVLPLEPRQGLVSVAHLVDRHRAGAYRQELEAFRSETVERDGTLHCLLTGPWPPYSFVQ